MFDIDEHPAPVAGLNPAQLEAATHAGGPLLVLAGAGTGKTRTLAARVGHLIASGVQPQRILLLTFSRRAARAMLDRAARATSEGAAARVWGGTFHAVANRMLRTYGRALGLPVNFTILDQSDSADAMDLIRGELGYDKSASRFPRKDTLAAIYSRTVNARARLPDVLERHFPWTATHEDSIREIFKAYTSRKRSGGLLDYDDLLLFWLALARAPGPGERMGRSFDHILVDEYQDTNLLQADILGELGRWCPNVTVVGDDAQAIYSFRAATVRNILDFPSHFSGAHVVKLEQNYRSTRPILGACNAVIGGSRELFHKELFSDRAGIRKPTLTTCPDESDQAHLVCERVLEAREAGIDLRRQAVLFRAGHHSGVLELELTSRNIPFVKYGGLKFLESAHVKDVLGFLRVLENPWDELAWFRVLQLFEGIGPAAARRIMAALGVRRELGDDDIGGGAPIPLRRLLDGDVAVPAAARLGIDALRAALADCSVTGSEPGAAVQVERIRVLCEPLFERRYDSAGSRIKDIEQLARMAAAYPGRAEFLADLTLDPPASTVDVAGPPLLDEDYLILSTIHSAKGCEWDVVHVIHAADGVIPSDMATGSDEEIEEERRLFYVALTRARDLLHIYFPLRYYHRPSGLDDPHSYAQLTRFIPASMLDLFDSITRVHPSPRDEAAVPVQAAAGVDAFLDNLWGGH